MSTKRRPAWLRYTIVGVSIVVVLGTIAWLARILFTGPAVSPKKAQQITLLKTPPPPPPPPKPQEKPPEPVKREEVKIDQPKPVDSPKPADEPPPLKPLGIDAEGSGAGDGFGLAANKGGRDITSIGAVGTGKGGGVAGVQRSFYGDSLQRHIQAILARQDAMRLFDHRSYVDLWVGPDGKIRRAVLEGTTAARNPDSVRAIEAALAALIGTGLREPPPAEMAMPIRVRLSNRGAG